MFRPPIWSIAAASALLGALLPPTASGHAGGEHPLTWVLEESCVPADSTHADDPDWAGGEELRNLPVAKPRLAGRFRSEAPRAVTVVLRSNASTSTVKAQVKRSGRFAVDLRSMPDQIRLRWDDNDGVLHATRWSGRLHAGCNDPGPAPPPGTPAGWVPSYPLGCGDSGPPCPPPAWVPPPISSE
jgi:hypothetical protein